MLKYFSFSCARCTLTIQRYYWMSWNHHQIWLTLGSSLIAWILGPVEGPPLCTWLTQLLIMCHLNSSVSSLQTRKHAFPFDSSYNTKMILLRDMVLVWAVRICTSVSSIWGNGSHCSIMSLPWTQLNLNLYLIDTIIPSFVPLVSVALMQN